MSEKQEHSRRGVLRTAAGVTLGAGIATGASTAPAAADGGGSRPPGQRNVPREVAILLYEGFTALDAVGPYEALCRVPGVRVTTVAVKAGPVRTDTGELGIVAAKTLRQVPRADVLVIPGGGERGTTESMADVRILEWIRRVHRHSTWTTSVCTGSLILGAAGLLRGLPATTYWASRPYLKEVGAIYTPGRFVEAGKIITAAGVSAGIDMGLHLAARLSDQRVGRAMELAMEYDPEPPFGTGSPEKADAETQALALKLLADSAT
ncbi:DJ-1/PfpI family protein [Streptomyces qinzhouensis]|uniref:DJ-1/PfpI family protein n=1 Tax=Streptomyces qinzhouensis TaxID=2599401 RepID=A0A5B8JEM8_9ACTN|nr:DJ-1/PfpI family protein [Streptomyces qinzhouensis]QDY80067.1 DJ-1/PfpI family protein [Streptomyces qinzhouensis]